MDRDTHDPNRISSLYWEFSYDEMIKYDLKANLDYVKLLTGHEKVIYIGHSQGTHIFLMGYTLYPDYLQNSIEKFVGVGPIFSLNSTVTYFL